MIEKHDAITLHDALIKAHAHPTNSIKYTVVGDRVTITVEAGFVIRIYEINGNTATPVS